MTVEKKDLARAKFEALLRAATDRELPNIACRVHVVMVADYMRSENAGAAWPSIATLCNRLGVRTDSTVRGALVALVARGHLVAEHRSGDTTLYRLPNPAGKFTGESAEFFTGESAEKLRGVEKHAPLKNAAGTPPKNAAATPPKISATNTGYESRIGKPDIFSAAPTFLVGEDQREEKQPRATPKRSRAKARNEISEDAQPTNKDADAAELHGLDGETFRSEWARFRDYHRSKGNQMADWSAAWRNWLRNRETFAATRNRRAPVTPRGFGNGHLARTLGDLDRD